MHCDLKEDNILIDEFGHAVIGDFGLALVFKEGEPEVYKADGSTCGTQGYIAPEALDKGVYSYPVDCWALGCILFSVLIGHVSHLFRCHWISRSLSLLAPFRCR